MQFIQKASLSLLFILAIAVPTSLFAQMVSVKGDDINLRKGPGQEHPILWEYGDGFPLHVLEKKGSWFLVEDFEKDKGWIHSSLVTSNPHVIVKMNKNNDDKINIRKDPTTTSSIVAQAKYGVVLRTIEQKNGWAKVQHENMKVEGWVMKTLLWGF